MSIGSIPSPPGGNSPRFRTALQAMSHYVPGRPSSLKDAEQIAQLASNELPYPPLPSVVAAINDTVRELHRYPDMYGSELIKAISKRHRIEPEQIALGCGSIEVLRQAVIVVLEPGDELVCAKPSFPEYSILASLLGAKTVEVSLGPLGSHDVEAMLNIVGDRTRVIIVCTPNNPTSTITPTSSIQWLLDNLSHEVLVVIDEAYQEFVNSYESQSAISLVELYPNLLVLRTFSKAFGLAGLRVGYGVGSTKLVEKLGLARIPFSVNSLAQIAAVASLHAVKDIDDRVREIVAERDRMMEVLLANQVPVYPKPQGNFLWFPNLPARPSRVAQVAISKGVLIRALGETGIRVTIGKKEENDLMLEVILELNRLEGIGL